MVVNNQRAWNRHATRYFQQTHFSYDVIDYGDPRCDTDEQLHLVPDVEGKNVLELGCGGGNIGITLAKWGANVTCLDLSNEQLHIAQQNADEQQVSMHFIEGAIDTFDFTPYAPLDMVISVCAFQYVANLSTIFERIYATLISNGCLIFSTDDPTFYSMAAKFLWAGDALHPSYCYDGPETWKWEETDDFSFTTYRHPIDWYINTLTSVGFTIARFHQLCIPHPMVKNEEEALERLYPRLMVFKCRK